MGDTIGRGSSMPYLPNPKQHLSQEHNLRVYNDIDNYPCTFYTPRCKVVPSTGQRTWGPKRRLHYASTNTIPPARSKKKPTAGTQYDTTPNTTKYNHNAVDRLTEPHY